MVSPSYPNTDSFAAVIADSYLTGQYHVRPEEIVLRSLQKWLLETFGRVEGTANPEYTLDPSIAEVKIPSWIDVITSDVISDSLVLELAEYVSLFPMLGYDKGYMGTNAVLTRRYLRGLASMFEYINRPRAVQAFCYDVWGSQVHMTWGTALVNGKLPTAVTITPSPYKLNPDASWRTYMRATIQRLLPSWMELSVLDIGDYGGADAYVYGAATARVRRVYDANAYPPGGARGFSQGFSLGFG